MSFGDIRVPVKLYSAVESDRVSFRMLHDQDEVPLRQQMVCALEDKPVPDDEIVKGLEVDENEYVLVEPEDLAELEPQSDRTIDVRGFVQPGQVDPRYYDRPYHLGPDGEQKKYASLAKALADAGREGICHWTFRKRSYNGSLRSDGRSLEIVTLRLKEEIGDPGELDLPEAKLSDKERKTARYLIEELSDQWDPSRYTNDFQKDLMDLIRTKAKGGKVKKKKVPAPEPTESQELADILEASLKEARKGKKKGGGKKSSGKKSESRKGGSR